MSGHCKLPISLLQMKQITDRFTAYLNTNYIKSTLLAINVKWYKMIPNLKKRTNILYNAITLKRNSTRYVQKGKAESKIMQSFFPPPVASLPFFSPLSIFSVFIQVSVQHVIFLRLTSAKQGLEQTLTFAGVLLNLSAIFPISM